MNLKELFEENKISQGNLILKMKALKHFKYQQQVSEWLRGVRLIDTLSVYYVSKVLNCPADAVLKASMISCGYEVA